MRCCAAADESVHQDRACVTEKEKEEEEDKRRRETKREIDS